MGMKMNTYQIRIKEVYTTTIMVDAPNEEWAEREASVLYDDGAINCDICEEVIYCKPRKIKNTEED